MDRRRRKVAFFAIFLAIDAAVSSDEVNCPSFKEFKDKYGLKSPFNCDQECMKVERLESENVYGTLIYHQNSDLCLSALHARTLNSSGGKVTIQKKDFEGIVGSCRNRICSVSTRAQRGKGYSTKETESIITNQHIGGDVILIHNSYHQDSLQVLCLKENKTAKFEKKNFRSWKYGRITSSNREYKKPNDTKDQSRLLLVSNKYKNMHAVTCLGSTGFSDVFAPINYQEATYKVSNYTWKGSKGGKVMITLDHASIINASTPLNRFPKGSSIRLQIDGNNQRRFELSEAKVEDSGLYQLSDDNKLGAYFNVLIRDCEAGKYGTNCQLDCPDCQNGGQCHSNTGECICPPGFIGNRCQHACLRGWFGTQCQLQCDKNTLLFDTPEVNSCKGLTFCFPSPMGCSCPPGFKGPVCKDECDLGEFGAGCSGSCNRKCGSEDCDKTTGSCSSHLAEPGVTDLSLTASAPGRLSLTWKDMDYPDSQHLYFVTYQAIKADGCGDVPLNNEELMQMVAWNNTEATLENLKPGTEYNVCVISSDAEKGHSQPLCKSFKTHMQEPSVNITAVCWFRDSDNDIRCRVKNLGHCSLRGGTNARLYYQLNSYLECTNEHKRTNYTAVLDREDYFVKDFNDIIPGSDYNITIKILNDAGDGQTWRTSLPINVPQPGGLPKVEEVVVSAVNKTSVRIQWKNPPCLPPQAGYHVYLKRYREREIPKSDSKCPEYVDFDGCAEISRLTENRNYDSCYIKIGQREWKYKGWRQGYGWSYSWGPAHDFSFTMQTTLPSKPGLPSSPERDPRTLEDNILQLVIKPPMIPGGRIINCFLETDSNERCSVDYTETELMNCTLRDLLPGKQYEVNAFCCQEQKKCGDKTRISVATKPKPELEGQLTVGEITISTITIKLPTVVNEGDAKSSMFIAVEHVVESTEATMDFEEEVKRLLKDTGELSRRRRDLSGKPIGSQEVVWIAGEVTSGSKEFIVGNGHSTTNFNNRPLREEESYNFGVLVVSEVLDQRALKWQQLKTAVVVKPPKESYLHIILPLVFFFLFLLVGAGIIIYIKNPEISKKIRGGRASPSSQNILPRSQPTNSHSVAPTNQNQFSPSVQNSIPLQPFTDTEPIYQNLGEENIYENFNRRIPASNAESYLNKIIESSEASQEFMSVPTFMKEITVGSIYKKKNRYGNNLPYDETRVKLAVINNDPTTEYINANHIQGYNQATRYIATQGPKDNDQSTLKDFWRMVVEQQVTEIIMVANFYEGGKCKVGQYFKDGEALRFDNYTIKATSSQHLPYFIISNIEVVVDGQLKRNVIHYHFTSWPDHGVLEEPYSVASLIATFIDRHQGGTVVVHCSAGIGRTGTILLVLLLREMLSRDRTFDPLEALNRLREGRARLVENKRQYNFALQVLDETLFGNSTTTPANDLQNNLDTLLDSCQAQYVQAQGLASPLSCKSAAEFSHLRLNRNPNILPPDPRRVYLNMKDGLAESQYINAVRVDGFAEKEAMIVTEYPVREAVRAFWRLILENNCSVVLMLNSYKGQNKANFEQLFPDVNKEISADGFVIRNKGGGAFGNNLTQFSLHIKEMNGPSTTVQVYQVLDWEYGCPVPEDSNILLSLADVLMGIKNDPQKKKPPLLCCGDGVTACGLVATLTFLLKRTQVDQVVDVYRAAVKIRRCREQFITCPEQFTALYMTASQYLSNFSIYANIN